MVDESLWNADTLVFVQSAGPQDPSWASLLELELRADDFRECAKSREKCERDLTFR